MSFGRPARMLAGLGLAGLLLLASAWLASCSRFGKAKDPGQADHAAEAAPVSLATAVARSVPVQIRTFGSVEAYSIVSIKSQVAGEIVAVHFAPGQDVKKGAPLFELDRRTQEQNLQAAEANLARDTALMHNAENDFQRSEDLFKKNMATQREYDQTRNALDAAKAAVRADQAAVRNAQIQLDFTRIASPLDGRAGAVLIDRGNLVKVNDLPLVTINQVRPIYVSFSVPQKDLSRIRGRMAAGALTVEATPSDSDSQPPAIGKLTFIDSQVDSSTGMIRAKATFDNDDGRLWPGQFANVVLTLGNLDNAIVVPSQVVQPGQQGQQIFVVQQDWPAMTGHLIRSFHRRSHPPLVAAVRNVGVGEALDGLVVISSGVRAGERVVTDGQLRLVAGAAAYERPGVEADGASATRPSAP